MGPHDSGRLLKGKGHHHSSTTAGDRMQKDFLTNCTSCRDKFERPQYAEILADHPDAPMSQVYGAPHLLRLFVRIGAMLAYTPLDEKSLALLLNYLHDFLKYLAKNSATLFSASDYEVAPPEYHRKAV